MTFKALLLLALALATGAARADDGNITGPLQIIPSQTGQSGKYLTTNGSVMSWGTVSGGGGSPGGTNGQIQYNNSGAFGGISTTGSGNVVLATSATLVTPALGTPASGVATNLTGLPLTTGVTGTLPVANGGTGRATLLAHGVLIGEGTSGFNTSNTGTSGQALISGGSSGDAAFGTLSVGGGGTGLTAGTSGGIPYYASTSSLASSAALTASRLVLGGGAGAAPTVLGSLGTTTTLLHGNAAGAPTFGAASLTADVSGILPIANGGAGLSQVLTNETTTGTINNYAVATANVRVNGASYTEFTGMAAAPGGTRVTFYDAQIQSGFQMGFQVENGSSTAANRFHTTNGSNLFVDPGVAVTWVYDSIISRWVLDAWPFQTATFGGSINGAITHTDYDYFYRKLDKPSTYRGVCISNSFGPLICDETQVNIDLNGHLGIGITPGNLAQGSIDVQNPGNFTLADTTGGSASTQTGTPVQPPSGFTAFEDTSCQFTATCGYTENGTFYDYQIIGETFINGQRFSSAPQDSNFTDGNGGNGFNVGMNWSNPGFNYYNNFIIQQISPASINEFIGTSNQTSFVDSNDMVNNAPATDPQLMPYTADGTHTYVYNFYAGAVFNGVAIYSSVPATTGQTTDPGDSSPIVFYLNCTVPTGTQFVKVLRSTDGGATFSAAQIFNSSTCSFVDDMNLTWSDTLTVTPNSTPAPAINIGAGVIQGPYTGGNLTWKIDEVGNFSSYAGNVTVGNNLTVTNFSSFDQKVTDYSDHDVDGHLNVYTGISSVGSAMYSDYGFEMNTSASQPSCNSGIRGLMWNVQGSGATADLFQICQYTGVGGYAWVTH